MADNLKSKSGGDRDKVAVEQAWEVSYMMEKFKVSSQQVAGAVRAVGSNDRQKVEDYLKSKAGR